MLTNGEGGGSAWEYEENFVEGFSRPLLIKDIPDKVKRFCRSMERGGESAWEYGENFVEAFSRPLLIKDIPDKVARFCRSMERGGGGGGNLHGNTRRILLRGFQGPS